MRQVCPIIVGLENQKFLIHNRMCWSILFFIDVLSKYINVWLYLYYYILLFVYYMYNIECLLLYININRYQNKTYIQWVNHIVFNFFYRCKSWSIDWQFFDRCHRFLDRSIYFKWLFQSMIILLFWCMLLVKQ